MDGIARNPAARLPYPVNFTLFGGEHLAILGANGVGKSLLVDTLLGKYPLKEGRVEYDFSPAPSSLVYENIKYITFRDSYGEADGSYYYQQRWNSGDQEEVPAARAMLGEVKDEALLRNLLHLFNLEGVIDKKVILLSSGELRKFQLIKALLATPRVLIIDNPFIGLDAATRELLHYLLEELSSLEHLQVILIVSRKSDIPGFITRVVSLPVLNGSGGEDVEKIQQRIASLPSSAAENDGEEMVRLNNVSIRYEERTILKNLDWVVRRGEKWALSGANGSGKSTLLSLLCADNPQSYACDISLFGRKRGTGESIWEIKKKIGYVSPEMHRAYMKNIPAIEIVASGLHDSIGLYKRPRPEQMQTCEFWMDIFGVAKLKDTPFLQISSGEQRLVLLARAFVKDPELLILDEPLHGLDSANRLRVKRIIEAFCSRADKTMIMVTHYREELPEVITDHLLLERN